MYTDATLTAIRNALSVVEVIGEYLPLKKSGQGFVGLCPFHNEKTPSFHVHPLKQCFHCFGCQKGGNIFTFVSAIEGMSFPETVQKLAKRAGVELHEYQGKRPAHPEEKINSRLLDANEWAAKYFHYLLTEIKEYKFALDYLASRGISRPTIEKFRIGVSPKGWNTTMDHMLKRKFTFAELTQAGLVVAREGSTTNGYDRFRMRLMFPIRDVEGKIVAFGGRLLSDEANQPKYINSPESPLFSKRKQLFGLYENQRGIRLKGEAIIVEGYMDVVGLFEKGISNAIATMGTALSEEHCQQLKSFSRRVVTVFDPDAGGQEAWHRSVHLFLEGGLFAKDLLLPNGLDPDEFVMAHGAEAFYQLCERAPRQVTKLLKEIASRGQLSEEQSSKILADLTPILVASRRLPDRALLWDDLSLVLKVSLGALKELSEGGPAAKPTKPVAPATFLGFKPRPPATAKRLDALDREFFQAVLFFDKEFLQLPEDKWKGGLREPRVRDWLVKLHTSGGGAAWDRVLEEVVQSETEVQLQSLASAKLMGDVTSIRVDASAFKMLGERLAQRQREIEIKALSAEVKLTDRLGNQEEGLRLLGKLKDLRSAE